MLNMCVPDHKANTMNMFVSFLLPTEEPRELVPALSSVLLGLTFLNSNDGYIVFHHPPFYHIPFACLRKPAYVQSCDDRMHSIWNPFCLLFPATVFLMRSNRYEILGRSPGHESVRSPC